MKKLKLIIAIFTVVLLVASCKKVCKTKCLNGGSVTEDCGCKCPGGYSGPNCENYNPCYNINCLNGGVCANGFCNCPPGYTGSNCGTALPLKSVTITKIIVNRYPTSKNAPGGTGGFPWDNSTTSSRYPDIYVTINGGVFAILLQTSAVHFDVNSTPQTYSIVPLTLNTQSGYYSINLFDDDYPLSDEFMGGIGFQPIDWKAGYPPTIHLSDSIKRIDYTVYVTWNF